MAVSADNKLPDAPSRCKVAVIAGPTGSGKSSLAIRLAKEFNGEIISADSRQIYRQLKIGTNRPDETEWGGIPHHLLGHIDLGDRYTAFDFAREAEATVRDIVSRGKRPVICGGTGLYLKALIDGLFELPDDDPVYRDYLLDLAARRGARYIHQMLEDVDPEEAGRVHYNNMIRVIRALEIYHLTGKPKSGHVKSGANVGADFDFRQIVLSPERSQLYKRIEQRVDRMMAEGLPGEAESVYRSEFGPALQTAKIVGYSELIGYFEDRLNLEQAVNQIKQNTRRYAKRQFTWFRAVEKADLIDRIGEDAFEPAKSIIDSFWDK